MVDARQLQPLWAKYHAARRNPTPFAHPRPVPHRHGFVFGFPNCSTARLDEYLDEPGVSDT